MRHPGRKFFVVPLAVLAINDNTTSRDSADAAGLASVLSRSRRGGFENGKNAAANRMSM